MLAKSSQQSHFKKDFYFMIEYHARITLNENELWNKQRSPDVVEELRKKKHKYNKRR